MAEVADAGEDHGDAEAVGGGDDVGVADRAAGLDDGGGSGLRRWFRGRRGMGRRRRRRRRCRSSGQDCFHGAEAGGVDAAHLAGADADGLAVAVGEAGVDDGVGFDVLADAPGEEQGAHLFGGGLALGDDAELGLGDAEAVGVLHEEAAGDLLEDAWGLGRGRSGRGGGSFWRRSARGFRGEGGRDDGFDEELGDLLGGGGVDLAVDADDAAEGGDGVGFEGAAVGFEDGGAGGGSAGVGVLDDGDGGVGAASNSLTSSQQASRSTMLL